MRWDIVHGLNVPRCSFDGAELDKISFGNVTLTQLLKFQ